MISPFDRLPDGRLGTTQGELTQLGLRMAAGRSPGDLVMLDDVPGLKYEYVESLQRILIVTDAANLAPHPFDLRENAAIKAPRAQAGWGTVLNYDLLSTSGNVEQYRNLWRGSTSLTLDGRAFSPYGTAEQSALLLSSQGLANQAIRLDTSYRYSDQDRLIVYDLGDTISSGLAWTRPIRIGGAQAQSNFALRPDLITMPLPSLGGTAAVPSTVDVYVNNIKTFSQDVPAGPFSVNNIPIVTGTGNAQLVIRDSAGQETRTSVPFFASTSLLAPGLNSWSIEAGLPRLSYGTTSDTYVETPVASATLRRGIFDGLTVETHAEAGSGLANGGIGAFARTGSIGVVGAAVSGSTLNGDKGMQGYVSYTARLFDFNLSVNAQRTFGPYNDLASATARLQTPAAFPAVSYSYLGGFFNFLPYIVPNSQAYPALYSSALPPRELEQFTIGAPLQFDRAASWSFSYTRLLDGANNLSSVLAASYSRSLAYDASLFATVFSDLGTNKNTGFVVGLSMSLGERTSVSSNVSGARGGRTATIDASRSLGIETGDYGWEVRDSEGVAASRAATASYRAGYVTARVGVSQNQGNSNAGLELRGSITTMGGDVFFSDWINDGFAVVDAGAPGVGVSYENRPLGQTDAKGMLLVPTLLSYQRNAIGIDPSNMPADAEIERTRVVVAPADRAGTLVKFNVRRDSDSALVIFRRADGNYVSPGASGTVNGAGDFVVGYDGQAYLKGLAASNKVVIQADSATCNADFYFAPNPGQQVRIGPIVCN